MRDVEYSKIKLIVAMFIFGTIGVVRKYIPLSSSIVALARGIIGALFILVVCSLKKEKISWRELKKNLVLLFASGILLGTNWIFLFEAYRYTSVATATICYYMAPVFVILASPLLFSEKLSLKKGVCAITAVCGMVLVSGVIESEVSNFVGILFGLGAAIMYATIVVLNKYIRDLSANIRTLFQLSISAVAILPYVLLTESVSVSDFSLTTIFMLAVAGIVYTGIAYTLYFGSIKILSSQTVALFSYIDPVVAVVLSMAVLKEGMTWMNMLGVVMVIGATVVSELSQSKDNKNVQTKALADELCE